MKKKFTFLIAALMLLTMISQPTRSWGQTKTDPTVTFSYTVYNGQGTSGTGSACSASSYGVSIASTKAYGASSHVKEYSGSELTFSSSVGNITSIAITTSQNVNNVGLVSGQPGSVTVSGSVATWSGDAASVKLYNKGSGQFRWTQIVVTYEASTTYTITCATGLDNGSIASNVSEAAENDDITITATPSSGYKLNTVTVTKDGGGTVSNTITGNTATFKMPADNVTVTAAFVQCHTVTCATGLEHGSISADMATAASGETVTITASPDEGYDLSAITVTNVDPEDIIIDGNEAVFDMPASDVTVSATFTAKTPYAITKTVTPANSGTITADANAWEGKTVNVSVSPAAGYVYSSITIKKTADESVSVPYTGNATDGFTFNMPAYAVTITATFTAADIYAKYSGELTEGDYVIYYSNKVLKNTVSGNYIAYEEISTPVGNQIVDPSNSLVWHISKTGDYWTIYNTSVSKYAASTGAKNRGTLSETLDNKAKWSVTVTNGDEYDFENLDRSNGSDPGNKWLRENTTYGWACYSTSTGGKLTLYKKVVTSTMAVASADHGTITATPAGGSAIAEGGSVSVASGKTITLNATGDDDYVLDAWVVYKTDDASTKVTVTSNTFTMPDYGVTVSASFRLPTTFTVQYSVNGAIDDELTINVAEGSPVTLPTSDDVTAPSGYAFAGWTENAATGELISGSTYTPTASTTLYLVFIKSGETLGYNKVTSLENITEGTYIIVNDNYCLPSVSTGSGTPPAKSNDYKVTNASSTSTYTSVPANTEWIFTGSNTAMTITNSEGKYLYETNDNNGVRVHTTSDTWAFELNTSAPCYAMKGANNKRYCATYTSDWRSYTTKDYINYNDGGRLYLYKKTPVYTLVKTISGSESMTNIEKTYIITVANGGVLTLSGTNNANAANLIIEDGGQLVCSNSVAVTMEKTVTAYTDAEHADWYTLSTPVHENGQAYVGFNNVANITYMNPEDQTTPLYNVYYLSEGTSEWINNLGTPGFSQLNNGLGYIYRRAEGATLEFTGNTNVDVVEASLTYTGTIGGSVNPIAGFNLLGNPYTHNITGSNMTFSEGIYTDGYYLLNTEGGWSAEPSMEAIIAPMTAFLVQASAPGATIAFTNIVPAPVPNEGKGMNYANDNIMFTVENAEYSDIAYVLFKEGHGLNKVEHRNSEIPMLYVINNGEEFAIADMSDNTGVINLGFEAKTMGQYTISLKAEGQYSYMHLIDKLTGEDTDMLVEDSYTFIGSQSDRNDRFVLRLNYNAAGIDSESDIFAYQNGNDIIVRGEGTLQVFDITGRMVMSTRIDGVETINSIGSGVYIFRMEGKTQKIVVR